MKEKKKRKKQLIYSIGTSKKNVYVEKGHEKLKSIHIFNKKVEKGKDCVCKFQVYNRNFDLEGKNTSQRKMVISPWST